MTDTRTTPAARLDELTRLYERHAYVAWNVALRTTLDDAAAAEAARRAFAAQVAHPDEGRLALDTGRLAIDAAGGVDSRSVEHPVLAATVHLAAVQRAVLALEELTDVRPTEVAATLGIDSERERQLRDGAYQQLGLMLGVEGHGVHTAYEDVPWDKPPAELWEALYPELHAIVTEQARPESAPAATVSTRRSVARPRGTRRLRSGALAAIAALAVAGVAWAATGGGNGGSDTGTQGYAGLPAAGAESSDSDAGESDESAASLLTPEELDRLRREEIEQLKRSEQRKDNPSLPPQERDRAARKVNDLVKLARNRQEAAEERELALRRQLAREREARIREHDDGEKQRDQQPAPDDEPQPPRDQPDDQKQPTDGQKTGGGGGDDRDPVETKCLYDPDSGTYICPE